MALTAQQIIDRAKQTLNDPDAIQWPELELLGYLSDAQRAAVLVKPEVNPVTVCMQVVPGSRQTIPDDGWLLLEVVRNMGQGDPDDPDFLPIAGRSISPCKRSDLDSFSTWHIVKTPTIMTGESQEDYELRISILVIVKNFVYEIKNRKTFYISPAQPVVTEAQQECIEIVYSAIPPELTGTLATDDNGDVVTDDNGDDVDVLLGIDDIYQPALHAYIMHRAHIKEASAESQSKSSMYFQQFLALLGATEEKDTIIRIEKPETSIPNASS